MFLIVLIFITVNHLIMFPRNPHMRIESERVETFDDPAWIGSELRATAEQLARAGFFFLNVRDRVKCWYCNGGLQNWEYDDDPWYEHAKWFPSCEFLLEKKGHDFVSDIVALFPNLRRPRLIGRTRQSLPIPPPLPRIQPTITPPPASEAAPQNLDIDERLKILQDQRNCKICFASESNTLFLPCGHLCCCDTCSQPLRLCPICRVALNGKICAYIS